MRVLIADAVLRLPVSAKLRESGYDEWHARIVATPDDSSLIVTH
jgi:hypothetical protein